MTIPLSFFLLNPLLLFTAKHLELDVVCLLLS